MIPFKLFLQSKSKWIADREQKLEREFSERIGNLQKNLLDKEKEISESIMLKEKELASTLEKVNSLHNDFLSKQMVLRSEYESKVKGLEEDLFQRKKQAEKILFEESLEFEKQKELFNHKKSVLRIHELDLEELERQIDVKKVTLENMKQELSNQIRILEAKARPDQVWMQAFNEGFSKALSMVPSFDEKVKKSIENHAIDETLKRLNHGNLLPKNKS